jgi:hypothetical protein
MSLHTCQIAIEISDIRDLIDLLHGESTSNIVFCGKPALEKFESPNRGSIWVCDDCLENIRNRKGVVI